MSGGAIKTLSPEEYRHAPLRGVVLADVATDHLHPQGYLDILTGAAPANAGRHIANLAGAPSVTESDTRVNPFEELYGKTADIEGEEQIQSTRVEISASIVCHTVANLKLLRPDLRFRELYGPDGGAATLEVGATTAAFTVTADAKGTEGNDITIALVNPGANNAVLEVSVSGKDIVVSLATDGTGAITSTGAQGVAAINAHATASTLVTASTADGSGIVAAQAATNLAGGTNGTVIGIGATRTLNVDISKYLKNIVLAYSTSGMTIGGAVILRKAINVAEDREYSFNDDMAVFGVEGTWRAHSDGTTQDPETGVILPNFDEHNYRETAIPA